MSSTDTRSPFRSRGFIAAATGVGIIVLAGLIVLATTLTRTNDNAAGTPTPTPSSSAPPSGNAEDESVCGLPGFDTTNTMTTVPNSEWELVGTVAAPTDENVVGPGTTDSDGFRSCFAHTAQGALYAASNMLAMGSDARLQPLLAENLAVPGPGREAAMGAAPSTTQIRYQISGYDITSYNDEQATIDLAVTVSSGQTASVPFLIQWSGGDWKAVLTDGGQAPLDSAPLQNLGGYTPWSGA
jgi:hypothetical protein